MKGNDIFYLILSIVLICLLITYSIFVIVDETKKFKKISYYKSNIAYETEWDKYCTMVSKQKLVICRKKMELLFLNILVKLRVWKIWK